MKKLLALFLLVTAFTFSSVAQVVTPVKWKVSTKKVSEGVYDVIAVATIESGWHLYDVVLPENGPIPTTFNLDEDETKGIELVGKMKATTKPLIEHSQSFGMDLKFFEKTVTFVQRVKLTGATAKLAGYIEYMACTGGQCVPPSEEEFEFELTK